METSRRIKALSLVLALLICFSLGCGGDRPDAGPDGRITLAEPTYAGESDDGYPLFRFTWSRVKKLWYYDMAIYMEMDGYAERSRLSFTDVDETDAEIPFLKGIHTDTATYRIKIRPLQSGNEAWSDVWQIAFHDGAYTVTANAPDFDEPKPAARPGPESVPAATDATAAHTYPEPLLTYAAKESGRESADLSDAAVLFVQVNHCEYGEPTQTVADPATIAAAAEAVGNMLVTGGSDGVSSTGTHYIFRFADAMGESLAAFAFQDGMLMENDGRYPVSGLDALFAVEGVMLADDWEAYWQAESEKADAYAEAFQLRYPASVFALSGYDASLLADIDPANIGFIRIGVSWNDYAGKLATQDPVVIRALYTALSDMRVVGKADEDAARGQEWTVYMSFQADGDAETALSKNVYLSFAGDYLLSDMLDGGTETPYIVEGLEAFFDCTDADVLRYLKAQRNTRRPEPTYS